MTPEQAHELQQHVQAIAKILYDNTPPEQLKDLAGIEQAVRTQVHAHVTPDIGNFLSQQLLKHSKDTLDG